MADPNSPVFGDHPAVLTPAGLQDHKELSAAAFERTRMPIVLADARLPDCPIVMANQAFLDLTGYTSEEIVGTNCRFLQGADTSAAAVAMIRLAVERGEGVDVELLNYRKDETTFWNQLHISPILDEDGEVAYFFASQIDVTELRKVQTLEASEHRLLMEVDHRAKNVLAVVDSIVRLSRADDPAAYAAAVQRRVQSLAQAHMLLSQAGWQEVELRDVLEAQIINDRHGHIDLSGPSVLISPVDVQSLSLVFHEFLVNAVTHGSLSRAGEGRLSVKWTPTGRRGLNVTWWETGSSVKIDSSPAGFGTIIARALVEKQLSGHVVRDWTGEGLTIKIELPDRGY